jgi:hypothetical protein
MSSSQRCRSRGQSALAASQDSQRGSLIRFHARIVGSSLYRRPLIELTRSSRNATWSLKKRRASGSVKKRAWRATS